MLPPSDAIFPAYQTSTSNVETAKRFYSILSATRMQCLQISPNLTEAHKRTSFSNHNCNPSSSILDEPNFGSSWNIQPKSLYLMEGTVCDEFGVLFAGAAHFHLASDNDFYTVKLTFRALNTCGWLF